MHFNVGSNYFHRPTPETRRRIIVVVDRPNCMDFIYRTEFEGGKILLWQLQCKFFFIDFHQGPPMIIWQGPCRPLHSWPLLKSALRPTSHTQ